MGMEAHMLGLPDDVRACLFDLDGVLTDTASVHRKAWKAMFDDFLKTRTDEPFREFDVDADYGSYVDGKRREDGVRSFLESRDITLPEGSPDDGPDAETVSGLGNRKNALFQEVLKRDGVTVFEGSRKYVEAAHDAGLKIAVVSSSANTAEVLRITGLEKYVAQRVDAITMRDEDIPGKPAPDSFLRGAELLEVTPGESAVFEDAIAGVQAGHAGHFAIVIGVNRVGQADALKSNGADVVVDDLADLMPATT